MPGSSVNEGRNALWAELLRLYPGTVFTYIILLDGEHRLLYRPEHIHLTHEFLEHVDAVADARKPYFVWEQVCGRQACLPVSFLHLLSLDAIGVSTCFRCRFVRATPWCPTCLQLSNVSMQHRQPLTFGGMCSLAWKFNLSPILITLWCFSVLMLPICTLTALHRLLFISMSHRCFCQLKPFSTMCPGGAGSSFTTSSPLSFFRNNGFR